MNTKTLIVVAVGIFAVALPMAAEGTGEAPVAVKTADFAKADGLKLAEATQKQEK